MYEYVSVYVCALCPSIIYKSDDDDKENDDDNDDDNNVVDVIKTKMQL